MRVLANSDDIKLGEFDNWAVTLGDGALPVVGDPSEDNIQLPQEMCIEVDEANNERDLKTFCNKIYPNFEQRYKEEDYMEGRAILAPTNKIRDNINAYMMNRLPTEEVVLLSADSTVQPGDNDRYPTETFLSKGDAQQSSATGHTSPQVGSPSWCAPATHEEPQPQGRALQWHTYVVCRCHQQQGLQSIAMH